jgi:choline dehydrogenase-like flavoprotein
MISRWDVYVDKILRAGNGEDIHPREFGVLSSPGISAGAFLSSPYAQEGVPDIQLTVFPTVAEPHLMNDEYLRSRKPNATSIDILEQSKQMLITVALMTPDARYEVILNSSDPIGSVPLIKRPRGREHYLSELDIKKLAWGVEQVIAIANTPPLSKLVEEILSPPADLHNFEAWVNNNHYPNTHWSGSARMGMNPKESVLDEKMRVRGVKGLYVADASTFPIIPNGNVHSTVAVVAAQAADIILREAIYMDSSSSGR